MSATLHEWLDVIRDEYLDGFVRDGGSAVKFVVAAENGRTPLVERRLRQLGDDLDYVSARVDARTTRVHMPQDIFFSIASQLDWRVLARRAIVRLMDDLPYRCTTVEPRSGAPILRAIASENGVEEAQISLELRREVHEKIRENRGMSRDFRFAMTHLLLTEMDDRGESAAPIVEWLTGENRRISGVRPFSIYNTIVRTNARHFLESLLHWLRFCGHPGLLLVLDDAQVAVRRNPRDGTRYYTRPAVMDHYEVLRELIDSTDRLPGLLMVVLVSGDFLDPDERGRGLVIYRALMGRIAEEVRDRKRFNPMSALVRLGD